MSWLDQLNDLNRPRVEQKEWMKEVDLRLATVDDLDTIAQECIDSGVFGLDLETTGLDQRSFENAAGRRETVDKIVGYCIAPTTEKGWYVPVRHREEGADANVPPRLAAEMVRKIQAGGARAVFHNGKFDQKFLDCEPVGQVGDWDDPSTWEDTLILAYLRNSRERAKGLKPLSKKELDREMIEINELFPPEAVKAKKLDFSTLDPRWEPVVWYAAADAVNTLALFHILHPQAVDTDEHNNGQRLIYRIEKACVRATIWMEDCRIPIDRSRLEDLIRLGQTEWWSCIQEVYDTVSEALGRDVRPSWVKVMVSENYDPLVLEPNYMESRERAMVGSQDKALDSIPKSVPSTMNPRQQETVDFPAVYDVTIPANLGTMLRELGVRGLVATEKSGQIKTSKDELDRVIGTSGDKYPFMAKVKRFREVMKGLGTFLFPIWWDTTPERSPDGCVWANFNGQKVDTGRFSTPTPREKRKEFFHGQVRWGVHMTPATYDKSKPECVRRIREVVTARPGYILFAIDYSGVELRIVTNLSNEPKWLTEFFRCSSCGHEFDKGTRPPPFCPHCGSDKIGDLHSLTAIGIHGEEVKSKPEFKQRRQEAKGLNFSLCYGGGGSAAAASVGVSKEEGWRLKNKYDETYKTLQRWWKKQHAAGRAQGYVTTAYGRRYPVPDINLPQRDPETGRNNGGFISKAERNSVNGPVQGSSADIMKLAMAMLYKEFNRRGWIQERRVLVTITIHDELVFEIREEGAGEVVEVIEQIMVDKAADPLKWPIPLKVDVEFGENWTVPYNLTEMTWNQGGGEWSERWVRAFPSQYENYLSCGGKPLSVSQQPTPSSDLPSVQELTDAPQAASEPQVSEPVSVPNSPDSDPVERGEGGSYVFRVSGMTAENAEKLARIIYRTLGRGTDTLHIRDADDNDLIGGSVKVSYKQFKWAADWEGLK